MLNSLGCSPWINIAPDSFFTVTNVQDSTLRDSLLKLYTTPIVKGAEPPGGEGSEKEPEKEPEEKEKKEGLFRRIFKKKDED